MSLHRLAAALDEVVPVSDLEQAQRELFRRSFYGLVVDLAIVRSFSALQRIRAEWPLLPLLLVAPAEHPDLINRAHPLRAQCLVAPLAATDLSDFFGRARQFVPVERPQLATYLTSFGTDHALTEREQELMVAGLDRVERGELLHRFRISENTLKSQVRGLLRKTGQASMDALLRSVMRDVLSQHGQ